ncbi:MAG: phospholipase A [Muribaculaceae bacterium]|nr:phospholipase A [Muribaculaceae bacterium]
MKLLYSVIAIFILLFSSSAYAQILGIEDQKEFTDSLKNEFYHAPYFGLYKDNYFTVGTSIHPRPNRHNSDVKFQISIAQRLTKTTLPGNSFLFLAYSQKTLWNVFEESLPMRDMNFNPGIGWSFPFFSKGRYVGKATVMIEHESNGRDGDASRSWNKISFSGSTMIDEWLMVHGKVWIPIIDGGNNKDILRYSGIYQTGCAITTPDKKFGWSVVLVKRKGWNLNFNTILEFNWRVHKKSNQYFFVQYYNGYGECLLDYNQFHSRLRVGLVIKPKFFSEF